MRQLQLAVAVVAAALAFGASATSAVAGEFVVSKEGPLRVVSGTAGEQQFEVGPFTVECTAAKGSGVASTVTISAEVKFSHCQDSVQIGGQPLVSKAAIKGHVGFVWGTLGSVEIKGLSITVADPRCTIVMGELEGLDTGGGGARFTAFGAAAYSNLSEPARNLRLFPSGYQKEMSLTSEATGVEVHYEGGCAGLPASEEGVYTGTFVAEIAGGDLEGKGEGSGWNKIENEDGHKSVGG
jgi:hypothetical protein